MTNILINLIIAYTEHLSRLEAHTRKQATTAASPARIRYIHNRADAIAAERAAFEAWRERLGESDRFTYITYPGLNHLFMPAGEADSILNAQAAYAGEKHVDAQVAKDIAAWIFAQ